MKYVENPIIHIIVEHEIQETFMYLCYKFKNIDNQLSNIPSI